jgi:Ala-tRNA(Pro) deacylase
MAVPARIVEFLRSKGVDFEEIAHAEAFASIEEARALGVEADDVGKVLVIRSAGGPVLFALAASSRLDMRAVRALLGDPNARLATENEMATDFSDYALGSVPPLAELVGAPLTIDDALAAHSTIVFAAGTHTDSIRMRVSDLLGLGPHQVAPVRHIGGKDDQGR